MTDMPLAPMPEPPPIPAAPVDPMKPFAPPAEPPPAAPTRADVMEMMGLGAVGKAAEGLHNVKASLRNAGEINGQFRQPQVRQWKPRPVSSTRDFLASETLDDVAEAAWNHGGHQAPATDEQKAYVRAFTSLLGERITSGVAGHVAAVQGFDDIEEVQGQAAALELSKFVSTLPVLDRRSSEKARKAGRTWRQFVKDPSSVSPADQVELLDFVTKFASETSWLKGAEFGEGNYPLVAVAGTESPVPVFGYNRPAADDAPEGAPAKVLPNLSDRFTDGLVDVEPVVSKLKGAFMVPHSDGTVSIMGNNEALKDQLRSAYPCAIRKSDTPVWMPSSPVRVETIEDVRSQARESGGRVAISTKGDDDPALRPGNSLVVEVPDLGTEELVYARLREAGYDSSVVTALGDALIEGDGDQRVARQLVVRFGDTPTKDRIANVLLGLDALEEMHDVQIGRSLYLHGAGLAPAGYRSVNEHHWDDFAERRLTLRTNAPDAGARNVVPVYVRTKDADRLPSTMTSPKGEPGVRAIPTGTVDMPDQVIAGKVGMIGEVASTFVVWSQEGRLPVVAPSKEAIAERFSSVDPAQIVEVSKRKGKLTLRVRPSAYSPDQPDGLFAVSALEVLDVLGLRSDDVEVGLISGA